MADPDVKIDRRQWDDFMRKVTALGNATVKVGVLQSSNSDHDGISTASLAAVHEFGSPRAGIPERSFLRSTLRNKAKDIGSLYTRVLKSVLAGRVTVEQGMGLIGQFVATAIKATIVSRNTEGPETQANKPETIRRKGSSTPLVDTGRLLGAITYEVEIK